MPIPGQMTVELNQYIAETGTEHHVFTNEWGDQLSPRTMERAFNKARAKVIADEVEAGVPVRDRLDASFRFHDLRHYFASYLISSGVDIKTVQKRLRHASAKTTLDVYGHMFPDRDDSTRDAVSAAFDERPKRVVRAV